MHPNDLPDEGSLWTAVDVARFLRASRSWVYGAAQSGMLPCMKLRGLLRFEPAEIRAWMDGRRSGPRR